MIIDGTFFDIKKSIVIGTYNLDKNNEEILKKEIDYSLPMTKFNNLNQLNIKEKKNLKEKGMISLKWIDKILNKIPCVSIFYEHIIDEQKSFIKEDFGINLDKKIDFILKILYGIKFTDYYNFIIVYIQVKYKNNIPHVKNILKDNMKKYLIMIEEKFYAKKLIEIIKDKSNEFFVYKNKYYKNQLQNEKEDENSIKKIIKIGVLGYLINDSKIFEYFEKAYNIMIKLVKEKKYNLCNQNEKLIYFEMRNVCDWLLLNIFRNNGFKGELLKKKIMSHFYYFNIDNFFKKENITIEIRLIFLFWKLKYYELINKLRTAFTNDIQFNLGIVHSLVRLIKIYSENKKQLDLFNYDLKIIETPSYYFEKFPNYKNEKENIDIDNINDIIQIYYCNLIKKNVINYNNIENNLKKLINQNLNNININNDKFNFYYFQIASYLNNFDENRKLFLSFYKNILYKQNSNFFQIYFSKVYNDILDKYNKLLLLENQNEKVNLKDNFLYIVKKFYFKKLSNEDNNFLKEFFNNKLENKEILTFNLNNNELLNIDFSFSNIHPKILDIITLKLEIKTNIDNSIIIPIKEIKLNGNLKNKEFLYKENYNLSNSNPLIKKFKILISDKENNLNINTITIKLQNELTFIYHFIPFLDKTIVLDEFDNKNINEYILIKYDKEIIMGELEYKYFKIDIENTLNNKIRINDIKSNFNLLNNKDNEVFNYQFFTKDENSNIINNNKNEQLNIQKIKINEDNSCRIEFILKINELGNYFLNFKIIFNILSLEEDNLSLNYEYENKLKIKVMCPFEYKCHSIPSITFGENIHNLINKPINHPYKIQSTLNNNIPNDVILKNIKINPSNISINISSPIEKLLIKNYQQIIEYNSDFNIPFHINVKENFNGIIGNYIIEYTNNDLELYSNKFINTFDFPLKSRNGNDYIENFENIDWKFYYEVIDFKLKIIVENLSDMVKNIILCVDFNKDNPDFLIHGKVKKKTLVSPLTKHCENFTIIPIRKKLKIIKINHIYIEEYPIDDKYNNEMKQIFNYNPGYININNSNDINEEIKK